MIVPLMTGEITAEEFEQMPKTKGFELIDGQMVEMPNVSFESSWVAGHTVYILSAHVHANQLGWVFEAEAQYNCFPDRPNLVRKCDVSFIRFGRFEGERLPEGRTHLAPDLAIEVISPSNDWEEIEEKVEEYLNAGVRRVWVVSPRLRSVQVYYPDGRIVRLNASKDLSGEDVLPGFSCRVADLFPPVSAAPAS